MSKQSKLNVKPVEDVCRKAHISDLILLKKATELYHRSSTIRLEPHEEVVRPLVCVQLALENHPESSMDFFPKSIAKELGATVALYSKILPVFRSRFGSVKNSFASLAVKFGSSDLIAPCTIVYNAFQERYISKLPAPQKAFVDQDSSNYIAAVFFAVAVVEGVKLTASLMNSQGLITHPPKIFMNIVNKINEACPELATRQEERAKRLAEKKREKAEEKEKVKRNKRAKIDEILSLEKLLD